MHNLVKSESLLQCGLNGYLALEDLCIIWEGGDSLKYLSISMCVCSVVGHVQLFATPWNVAHQASLSMEFSRQKYWSRLPFPSPGNLPYPAIEPSFLMSPVLAGGFFTTSATWEAQYRHIVWHNLI